MTPAQRAAQMVLEIYRITLLSNNQWMDYHQGLVLEIYRITLLSNGVSN